VQTQSTDHDDTNDGASSDADTSERLPQSATRKPATGEGDSGLGGAEGDGGAGGLSGVTDKRSGGPATTGESRQ
jgi:hypothetical protein